MAAERGRQAAGGFFDVSPAKAYFDALEDAVISLRGAPLQLSPDDWQITEQWHAEGIPIDVVRESIQAVIDRRRAKELEIPRRLAFYRQPVERAWKKIGGLTVTAKRRSAPTFDIEARLGGLARAVSTAAERQPSLCALATELQDMDPESDVEAVEKRLAELDERWLERAAASLDSSERQQLEAQLRDALAFYEDRFPEPASPAVEERLRSEALRRLLGLPVLSLFAPEAAADARETPSSS